MNDTRRFTQRPTYFMNEKSRKRVETQTLPFLAILPSYETRNETQAVFHDDRTTLLDVESTTREGRVTLGFPRSSQMKHGRNTQYFMAAQPKKKTRCTSATTVSHDDQPSFLVVQNLGKRTTSPSSMPTDLLYVQKCREQESCATNPSRRDSVSMQKGTE